MAKTKHACPKCNSANLVKDGKTATGWPRYRCTDCGKRPSNLHRSLSTTRATDLRKRSRYVVTSAQNDTPLNKPFFAALVNYCERNDAQLIVIPTRYRNPDCFHTGIAEEMTWPQDVRPYLLDRDVALNQSIKVMGDAKINATATNPLSGMEAIAGQSSAIYGHAQLQMIMVATPRNDQPRMLHTTGSVSLKNYSRSKAGKKADFHHVFGATVIETRANRFHVREILADNCGGFYDLDKFYTGDKVTGGHKAAALVLADEHVKFLCEDVRAATWGRGGMVDLLRPRVLVRHDLHDHYSASHHHERDTLLKVAKSHAGDDCVRAELQLLLDHLTTTTPRGTVSAIAASNHHDHLRQWLNRFDANRDPKNALFAWTLLGQIAAAIESGEDAEPFKVFLLNNLKAEVASRVEFLDPNEPHEIEGIDVSQHGDRGPNGSRGALNAYGRLNRKMIVGHGHTPGIRFGTWQVGVSAPDMDYAVGLSSWLCTHCLIYPNGKRAFLSIIDGKWKG